MERRCAADGISWATVSSSAEIKLATYLMPNSLPLKSMTSALGWISAVRRADQADCSGRGLAVSDPLLTQTLLLAEDGRKKSDSLMPTKLTAKV
jgi:hypothetical protein